MVECQYLVQGWFSVPMKLPEGNETGVEGRRRGCSLWAGECFEQADAGSGVGWYSWDVVSGH